MTIETCTDDSLTSKASSPISKSLLKNIRDRFYYADSCPFEGPRIYFENAGGSLTLKSVIQVTSDIGCIPDNEHRDNKASAALSKVVEQGKRDLARLFGATKGTVFGGETGTECLFRLIRTASLETPEGGSVLSCSLEHPATYDSTQIWAKKTGREWIEVPFDVRTGVVTAEHYAQSVRPDTRVATIIHTNPVTGMVMDVKSITEAIRSIAPDCYIIVDGIQHAPHGVIGVDDLDIDAYVLSLYKVFSKFNNGYAWVSERFTQLPHDKLLGKPADAWELGSRDPSALAAVSEVVNYLEWLGLNFITDEQPVPALEAAGKAMFAHERHLVDAILNGTSGLNGLKSYDNIRVIGDLEKGHHESVVSFSVDNIESKDIVTMLSHHNIRIHARSADAYSGNILRPLGLTSVARVSLGHYNSLEEVTALLAALEKILNK
ncbi:aminotransferase class V-fold PLP-dependent enzyme [Marinobacterium mangrovicola]|uniref:Selenocysteine lyase/cysteine desulfurase n=1 Tax=Marinobacterium mangrovicola TaxID=1476959 RepID=A0A4R1GFT9_9GAMM|nr:aminotransferase class V-fold PLP-dependent enzyme [Marinobacterium mangrovicola]TCK05773.1 selenocysteine lyase/cysteine desulfurase [Marinobacterium mangrovicola]